MRHTSIALVLSLAVSLTGTSLWAQAGSSAGSGSGINNPGTNSPSNTSGNTGLNNGNSLRTGNQNNASSNNMNSGSSSAMNNSLSSNANHQQFEGQLVDLFDVSRHSSMSSSSSSSSSSGGGRVVTDGTPNLRIRVDNPSTPSGGAANPPIAGTSVNTSDSGKSFNPAANPNMSTTPHVGDSAGTYNHPGAAGGSSDTSASIAGSGRLDPGDRPSGTVNNTASPFSNSSMSNFQMPPADSVRAQLNAGIPAAIISNGQAYVIVADPKQFAQFAGQTVRIDGTLSGNNLLLPDRVEVRQSAGNFQSVNISKPSDISAPHSGTAENR